MHIAVATTLLVPLALCGGEPLAPAIPNVITPAIDRALPAVVKLYGASLGATHGYGTGVLVSADGLILTVDSILTDARNLRAVLADGRRLHAETVRRDASRELALLKIEANRLPFLVPEPSTQLEPGDGIVAAGNCFKVAEGEETVSFMYGILSTRTALDLRRRATPLPYGGELLIIDAITSNPGMAGGPLLDTEGRWIGLIGPIADSTNTNTRLNYAIPSEELLAFLDQKSAPPPPSAGRTPEPSAEPYLGIHLFKLGYRNVAAYVDRIAPASPAEAAGLQPDDLIVAIDNRRVSTTDDYQRWTAQLRPGQTITLTIKRGEEVLNVQLIVGAMP